LPFTVKRLEKPSYIKSLENADQGEPQDLVTFFSLEQKKSVENAMNYKTEKSFNSLADLASLLNKKIDNVTSEKKRKREDELSHNRKIVFDNIYDILGSIKEELSHLIPQETAKTAISSVRPDQTKNYYHTPIPQSSPHKPLAADQRFASTDSWQMGRG
jgi:transcriptional regulator of heat shock response